jgi:hypothetical protein
LVVDVERGTSLDGVAELGMEAVDADVMLSWKSALEKGGPKSGSGRGVTEDKIGDQETRELIHWMMETLSLTHQGSLW